MHTIKQAQSSLPSTLAALTEAFLGQQKDKSNTTGPGEDLWDPDGDDVVASTPTPEVDCEEEIT